jgi:hypothetical protein
MQIFINQSLEKSLDARSPQVAAMPIDQEKIRLARTAADHRRCDRALPTVHRAARMRA